MFGFQRRVVFKYSFYGDAAFGGKFLYRFFPFFPLPAHADSVKTSEKHTISETTDVAISNNLFFIVHLFSFTDLQGKRLLRRLPL